MSTNAHVIDCDDIRVARAIQYVTRDLTQRPTLAAVSKVAGLERTYFCKCFRKHFGVSFYEWNTQTRIGEAQRLLSATSLPINAVNRPGFSGGSNL